MKDSEKTDAVGGGTVRSAAGIVDRGFGGGASGTGGDLDATTRMAKALSHPLRASILIRLNEKPASPVQLSRMLDAPVARVAYHVKLLEELDCIELIELRPVRGSVEHIYRATRRVLFEEEDWEALPESARRGMSAEWFRNAFRSVAKSMETGEFERRNDTHFSATWLELDQAGWDHLATKLMDLVREALDLTAEATAAKDGRELHKAGLVMTLYPRQPDDPIDETPAQA